MKVYVRKDEFYPFYYLYDDYTSFSDEIDLTEEDKLRYCKAVVELKNIFREINQKLESSN